MKKLKAFTLVELLIVMAIISFLVVGAWSALQYGLAKSRDTQREKTVRGIQAAVEGYYSDHGQYPQCPSGSDKTSYHIGDYTEACDLEDIAAGSNPPLAGYLDADFKSPLPGGASTEGAMAYYRDPVHHKYAICTLTELTHHDNEKSNYYSADHTGTSVDYGNGCFCLGPGADDVMCRGLTNANGSGS